MNEITYHRQGDYMLPDLTLPSEEQKPIGKYGLLHRTYIKQYKRSLYTSLLTSGKLNGYLSDVDTQAKEKMDFLVGRLKEERNITECLKASDQMRWAQEMNNIRNVAEEIVLKELVYT